MTIADVEHLASQRLLMLRALGYTDLCCHGNGVTYKGISRSGVETFLGIPYGQDTGGSNRFKRPKPYKFKPGATFFATSEGPSCPQELGATLIPLYLQNFTSVSEDCLHLNVYRPNGTRAGERLPVMVFIHGGSFIGGSKDEPAVQPEGMILESIHNGSPVINVHINYRLGIFGFAQSDALSEEGSTNMGIRDQRLALEWVRDNIRRFGGDCERITIYGQSSGGLAVGLQIMAYGASKPLPFQQAICESQVLEPGITGTFTEKAMARVRTASPCSAHPQQSEAFISCLRGLSLQDLLKLQTDTHQSDPAANIGDEWLPMVDGDMIPQRPSELIAQGKFGAITSIIGWCNDDTNPFTPLNITTGQDTHDFLTQYAPSMSPNNVERILDLYPISDFQSNPSADLSAQFYRSGRILRDILMTSQPVFFGSYITSLKHKNVYLYDQNQTVLTPVLDAVGFSGTGVVHTSEFAYVFGNFSHYVDVDGLPNPKFTESDYALLTRESRSWSTFAATGQPSLDDHKTLQGWRPAFKGQQTGVYVIGGPSPGFSTVTGPGSSEAVRAQKLKERCDLLNSPEIVRQLDW
ncbi:putative lipase [Polychaeton citri CBS 116435]|uniref:Carboxylic ester hydrolase n=1 Tax=Polychaeton citri CBS 116435 TaxID=1314669 RepID=A0A9P4Q691_9PEZI|nr:putative lipase [Polychaeton citri CBS 116435]